MEKELKQVELPPGFGQTRGSEHEVWRLPEGGRVLEATHREGIGNAWLPIDILICQPALTLLKMAGIK